MSSDIYDHPALVDALFPAGAHLPYYVEFARQTSGVLELACGPGQLTVPIATAGFPTVGLDLSAHMLTTAKERAATANVSVGYVLADMRNFDPGRKFALIFIARNSLLHLHSTDLEIRAFNDAADQFIQWAKCEHHDKPNTWKRLRGSMTSLKDFFKTQPLHTSASARSRTI